MKKNSTTIVLQQPSEPVEVPVKEPEVAPSEPEGVPEKDDDPFNVPAPSVDPTPKA